MTVTEEMLDEMTDEMGEDVTDDLKLAAPCGLYCGICPDYEKGICHGCGCTCAHTDSDGSCAVQERHEVCPIYQCCVEAKKLSDCSACPEFPCAIFICFTHDPLDRNHLPALMNLQRRRRLGLARWLQEERAFWRSEEKRRQWRKLQRSLEAKGRAWEERKRQGKGRDEGWRRFLSTLREARSLTCNERRRRG